MQATREVGTKTMRAITLESFDGGPTLREIPTPQADPGEVLVRVRASSVNPVDNAIVSGMLKDMVEHEFPSCSAATSQAS